MKSDKSKNENINHRLTRQSSNIDRESSLHSGAMLAGTYHHNSFLSTISTIFTIALFLWACYRVLSLCNLRTKCNDSPTSGCCGVTIVVGYLAFFCLTIVSMCCGTSKNNNINSSCSNNNNMGISYVISNALFGNKGVSVKTSNPKDIV